MGAALASRSRPHDRAQRTCNDSSVRLARDDGAARRAPPSPPATPSAASRSPTRSTRVCLRRAAAAAARRAARACVRRRLPFEIASLRAGHLCLERHTAAARRPCARVEVCELDDEVDGAAEARLRLPQRLWRSAANQRIGSRGRARRARRRCARRPAGRPLYCASFSVRPAAGDGSACAGCAGHGMRSSATDAAISSGEATAHAERLQIPQRVRVGARASGAARRPRRRRRRRRPAGAPPRSAPGAPRAARRARRYRRRPRAPRPRPQASPRIRPGTAALRCSSGVAVGSTPSTPSARRTRGRGARARRPRWPSRSAACSSARRQVRLVRAEVGDERGVERRLRRVVVAVDVIARSGGTPRATVSLLPADRAPGPQTRCG